MLHLPRTLIGTTFVFLPLRFALGFCVATALQMPLELPLENNISEGPLSVP